MPPAIVVSRDIRPLRRAVLFGSALVMVGAVAVTGSRWPADGLAHQSIRWIGIALMIACIGGRSWSRLYLGWHKTRRVVRVGPYSVCRNPLYDFSILGAIGAAAQTGSITIALLAGGIVWLVLYLVTLREEETLAKIHGEEYRQVYADGAALSSAAFAVARCGDGRGKTPRCGQDILRELPHFAGDTCLRTDSAFAEQWIAADPFPDLIDRFRRVIVPDCARSQNNRLGERAEGADLSTAESQGALQLITSQRNLALASLFLLSALVPFGQRAGDTVSIAGSWL